MPKTLILAPTWREGQRRAAADGIPNRDRAIITSRASFARLGYATKGLDRRVYPGFETHPRRQEILDALWVSDQHEAI